MKTILIAFLTGFISLTGYSQSTESATFEVAGNCGMCKNRIEEAATIDGVTSADWNLEDQMLTIVYDPEKVDLDDIHQRIADAGHDTEKVRAKDETYKKLPACCQFERIEESNNPGNPEKKSGRCKRKGN